MPCAELKKLPFVESVGFAQNAIGTSDGYMGWGRGNDEHQMSLQVLPCDYEYTQTMGLKILEGRNFNEADMKTGAYVLNKAAMQQYNGLPWATLSVVRTNGDLRQTTSLWASATTSS